MSLEEIPESETLSGSSTDTEDPYEEVEDALESFRKKWKNELKITPAHQLEAKEVDSTPNQIPDEEALAKNLFLKGIELEKRGKLYEAIKFYRKAVQLVPDVEFRLDNTKKTISIETDHESENEPIVSCSDQEGDEDNNGDIFYRIYKKMEGVASICYPKIDQKTAHISVLPTEMILQILRWVVSSDLDLRSLEMFALVCRGFYICARDSEIWHLACLRVWGLGCGHSPRNYLSWRHMYIERNRINFNGCYIGKTTYIRHGESSFQDQFYQPWHLVTYYRYLRFFPGGGALVLTSAEEPAQCVGQLRRGARPHVLRGHYRLRDDCVTVVARRQGEAARPPPPRGRRRAGDALEYEMTEQTFHMELAIRSTVRRRHGQLVWKRYEIMTKRQKGDDSVCDFDLLQNRFPPLWFSRVKSYTADAESPLV